MPWRGADSSPGTNTLNKTKKEQEMKNFIVKFINWIPKKPSILGLKVKVRHGEQLYECEIAEYDKLLDITLEENDQGLADGQFCVLYCYGGGIISKN